ncbi:MAG: RDD family protein [Actinobacteria bacterium]|nr:RDD family protein [Actinomycetota bacterium]NBY15885.1 RDD family protein [Actinomycetota bacterium]
MEPENRLGLPEFGPGSIAGVGRRIAAFFLDYFACWAVAHLVAPDIEMLSNEFRLLTLAILFSQIIVLTTLTGSSFGQRVLGMQVTTLDLSRVDVLRILARTAMIFTVIPAAVWDRDTRGLHDRLLGTVVVRTR